MELEIALGLGGLAGWAIAGVLAWRDRGVRAHIKQLAREKEGFRAALVAQATEQVERGNRHISNLSQTRERIHARRLEREAKRAT